MPCGIGIGKITPYGVLLAWRDMRWTTRVFDTQAKSLFIVPFWGTMASYNGIRIERHRVPHPIDNPEGSARKSQSVSAYYTVTFQYILLLSMICAGANGNGGDSAAYCTALECTTEVRVQGAWCKNMCEPRSKPAIRYMNSY